MPLSPRNDHLLGMRRPPSQHAWALRTLLGLLVSSTVALALAQPASASTTTIGCRTGAEQRCPLQPESTAESGALEYEPNGAFVRTNAGDTLLTSGWIEIPSTPSLFMSSVGNAEIRSITLPAALLESTVAVSADAEYLGSFAPGELIDFEALLGADVGVVRIAGIELLPASNFPLLVAMRSFDVFVDDSGLRTAIPGRVHVHLTPEPTTFALVAIGLILVTLQRRGLTSRCS